VTRLAIGHTWGISLYELRPPANVRLVRVMAGHEGEVMSVAPASKGQLLVSASRDQTIAGWSLEKWKGQRALGAIFAPGDGGKVVVRDVEPGSPAWECGLTPDDEIVLVVSANRSGVGGFVYNPTERDLVKDKFVLVGRYQNLDRNGILKALA